MLGEEDGEPGGFGSLVNAETGGSKADPSSLEDFVGGLSSKFRLMMRDHSALRIQLLA